MSTVTRVVVDERGSTAPYIGYLHYGYTLYQVGDTYEVVLHTRTYDGVRVADKWDTPSAALEATELQAAKVEAREALIGYMRAITGSGNS